MFMTGVKVKYEPVLLANVPKTLNEVVERCMNGGNNNYINYNGANNNYRNNADFNKKQTLFTTIFIHIHN